MSYDVSAYLVDLDRLHHVYGSNAIDLVRAIEWNQYDYYHYATREIMGLNEQLAADGEPTVPSVHDALQQSVAGHMPIGDEHASYGFALILFCRQLGTTLPNTAFTWLAPAAVGFLEQAEPMAALLFHSASPGPIMFPKDFGIGHLTWEQAAHQLATWRSLIVADDPDDRAWEEQVCMQYRSWLEQAVETQRAIISFFS
jgi:hypothetical protein